MKYTRLEGSELLHHAALVAAALTDASHFTYSAVQVKDLRHVIMVVASNADETYSFLLNSSWQGSGRMNVSGCYPELGTCRTARDWDAIPYGTAAPSITYKWTRTPKAVAGDLARRFLPEFLPVLDKARAAYRERVTWTNDRDALTRDVSGLLGLLQQSDADPTFSLGQLIGEGYGSLHVNGPEEK